MFDSIDADRDGGWLDDILSGAMKAGGAATSWAGGQLGGPAGAALKTFGSLAGGEEAQEIASTVGDFYTDFRGSRGTPAADTTDPAYAPGAAPTLGAQARDAVGGDVANGIFTAAGGASGLIAGSAVGLGTGAPLGMLAGLSGGSALGGLAGTAGGAAIGGLGAAATGGLTGAATGATMGALLGPLGMLAGGALGGLGGAASSGLLGMLGGGLLGGAGGSLGGAVLGSAGGGVAGAALPALAGAAIGGGLANPSTNPFEMWAD
jgi:hypothetical protein